MNAEIIGRNRRQVTTRAPLRYDVDESRGSKVNGKQREGFMRIRVRAMGVVVFGFGLTL